MYSWEKPEDRVAIIHMNAELRHAQLELLSAHCATHQLRLHFSTRDLARYAQRDVLQKSVEAASALNEYYSNIQKQAPSEEELPKPAVALSEEVIGEGIARISAYFREQREHYLSSAVPLSASYKAMMWPFFNANFLDQVKIVEQDGTRVSSPSFYQDARALGLANLPDFTHMASLTFQDVIVFNEKIKERTLFHGLVHAMQFQILGVDRYLDLFVRGFLRTKFHFTVPIEAHAFSLEERFVRRPVERFSVEEQVRLWANQERY
jgi:hypothetical protein